MIHLVLYFLEETILWGPAYMRWMYPIERLLKKLKERVKNRARAKGSIAEGYMVTKHRHFALCILKVLRPSLIGQIEMQITPPQLNHRFQFPNFRVIHMVKKMQSSCNSMFEMQLSGTF